jgi:pyochelin biosynthetic protein PchC
MSSSSIQGAHPSVKHHKSYPTHDKGIMAFHAVRPLTHKVICLPHAGCGAAAFKTLSSAFFHDRDMVVVQYPGRETRMRDPFFADMQELVDEIMLGLEPHLNDPYVLFGHSMGAKVAYEVVLRLQTQNKPLPQKMAVSCSPAPHRPSGLNRAFQESDAAFLQYLQRLGGVPDELLAVPDLLEMVLPILRADFELLYRYLAPANAGTISCPLYGIASSEDVSVTPQAVSYWQERAAGTFNRINVEGGHFYFPKLDVCFSDLID